MHTSNAQDRGANMECESVRAGTRESVKVMISHKHRESVTRTQEDDYLKIGFCSMSNLFTLGP